MPAASDTAEHLLFAVPRERTSKPEVPIGKPGRQGWLPQPGLPVLRWPVARCASVLQPNQAKLRPGTVQWGSESTQHVAHDVQREWGAAPKRVSSSYPY